MGIPTVIKFNLSKNRCSSFPFCTVYLALATALLGGCADYQITLNERAVYTPPPLLANFALEDKNLQACIEQTIYDQKIYKVEELKQLVCTNAGVESLTGIHIFTHLEQVNLSDNGIRSLDPLANLEHLSALSLRGNALSHIQPLKDQQGLQSLDLSGNKNLRCEALGEVVAGLSNSLQLIPPEQCN